MNKRVELFWNMHGNDMPFDQADWDTAATADPVYVQEDPTQDRHWGDDNWDDVNSRDYHLWIYQKYIKVYGV